MTDIWIAPVPCCPEHGQMRRHAASDTWTCAGWDGEGCDYTAVILAPGDTVIPAGVACVIRPQRIGVTDGPIELAWGRDG